MAKRKKGPKVQKRAKSATRGKARRSKAAKAPVKKAARKRRTKQPVAPAVEAREPAPEFEDVSQVSPRPDEPEE